VLEVSPTIRIPLSEFQWSFVRSGGPGGQNVNKVASKVILRWNFELTKSLTEDLKARLRPREGRKLMTEGELVFTSQRYRDQIRNRQDCLEKLAKLLRYVATPPKQRKPTKPTRASHRRRLVAKRHRTKTKQTRRTPIED
jgi:ribosome-associated protein